MARSRLSSKRNSALLAAAGSFWTVIPAGGAGTRLWPLSRAARPKFLLPLDGDESLLQQTVNRLAPLAPAARTMVVCGPGHAAAVARQLPALPDENILVEPAPRGSGPAIGLAAALIARIDPTAVMGSFAADHIVRDQAAFQVAVRAATAAAATGWLTTIGLTPTRPETGFGYIERSPIPVITTPEVTVFRASRFHEKPGRQLATEYVASGNFFWNAGMFVWRVDAFLAELDRLQPALASALREVAAAWGTPAQDQVTVEVWARLPSSTVDEGVMEHAAHVAVVPAEMGWSDIGDWDVLGQLGQPDAAGNSLRGDVVPIATTNSAAWSETGRLIAMVGLDNVVVVDTDDAILVANRGRSQEVRQVVELLKQRQREELT